MDTYINWSTKWPESVTVQPSFWYLYGSTTSKHPSYHQDEAQTPAPELRWFMDMMPFDGGNLMSPNPGATLISGQLYKYILYPTNPLTRKQLATLASSGGSSLLDVSGPGSVISEQPSDSYKYCVANVAGECRAGSADRKSTRLNS